MNLIDIVCPVCGETFGAPAPHESELPCSLDYDCEVCCRPMQISFWEEDGEISAQAAGLGE